MDLQTCFDWEIINYRINNSTIHFFSELHSVLLFFFCVSIVFGVLLRANTHTHTHLHREFPPVPACVCVSSAFRLPAVRPRFPADPHLPARSQRSMAGCCWSTAPEEGQGGGEDKQERGERGDFLSFPGIPHRGVDRKMWKLTRIWVTDPTHLSGSDV